LWVIKKNKSKIENEEPRRCSRLRDQEDANMTELSMKRVAKKNEIPGNDKIPTILNSSDEVLLVMNNKLELYCVCYYKSRAN
jgi:hypothetical protein